MGVQPSLCATSMSVSRERSNVHPIRHYFCSLRTRYSCSPCISSLLRAFRAGYLDSFPWLTAQLVVNHPPHTIATAKGHLDQHRQGLNSTADTPVSVNSAPSPEVSNPPLPNHTVYVTIVLASDTSHSDLTGRFPVLSTTGNQYLFISQRMATFMLNPWRHGTTRNISKRIKKQSIFPAHMAILFLFSALTTKRLRNLNASLSCKKSLFSFAPPPIIEHCTLKGPFAHTRIILSQHC